ncbi:hypothetical protein CDO52_15930 [Nocardiopsis gilva YIM 90087]|uniref:Uncharacterized protein n=1 Tax=Nocardiopsis gilva YIM 90087 TaxID=1235441 RepID=A0A223S7H3_9ACTN|nr:hypothetical protein [Nocardiopsis gilva]ASU84077.1 hypothetical protein CDO52_15930 [Nocardiopsis gilva YIM 90087]
MARSAPTVVVQGDSMPPEPPLDEAYFARMLEGIARRGYIPARACFLNRRVEWGSRWQSW